MITAFFVIAFCSNITRGFNHGNTKHFSNPFPVVETTGYIDHDCF